MSEELKPCPFCGGEAIMKRNFYEEIYVQCMSCKATAEWDVSKDFAAQHWNRRVERRDDD